MTIVQAQVDDRDRPLQPAGGDYDDWGLHLWGDAIADSVTASVAWDKPFQRTGTDAFGAVYAIPLKDDTKPVNFIMHRPSGDSVPSTREPGRRPVLRAAGASGDLAQAGRPGGVLRATGVGKQAGTTEEVAVGGRKKATIAAAVTGIAALSIVPTWTDAARKGITAGAMEARSRAT